MQRNGGEKERKKKKKIKALLCRVVTCKRIDSWRKVAAAERFGCVLDELAAQREKYKTISTDLDTTFTELAGY